MISKQNIEQFYKDVKSLGLKFPVAEITRATGHSKGNVSRYLSKKLEPSEQFLKAFYEQFPSSSKMVSRETYQESPSETPHDIQALIKANGDLSAAIKGCQEDQRELIKMVKLNSDLLREKDQSETAVTKTLLEYLVEVGVKAGLWKTAETARTEIDKRLFENLGTDKEVYKSAGAGK